MSKYNVKDVEDILYNDDESVKIEWLRNNNNPYELHIFGANYNWNDGFTVPFEIVNNPQCDLGTALMMFELSEGYISFLDGDNYSASNQFEWKKYVNHLYNKIVNDEFKSKRIAYRNALTKVDKYKIKRKFLSIPQVFLDDFNGEVINFRL